MISPYVNFVDVLIDVFQTDGTGLIYLPKEANISLTLS